MKLRPLPRSQVRLAHIGGGCLELWREIALFEAADRAARRRAAAAARAAAPPRGGAAVFADTAGALALHARLAAACARLALGRAAAEWRGFSEHAWTELEDALDAAASDGGGADGGAAGVPRDAFEPCKAELRAVLRRHFFGAFYASRRCRAWLAARRHARAGGARYADDAGGFFCPSDPG